MPTYTGPTRMRYELPKERISLTGYIVRRLHKTQLLLDSHPNRLARIGIYALAASTSYGPAAYQPRFDAPGTTLTEPDPETGAHVQATCTQTRPHYTFTTTVRMPSGDTLTADETITGTTVSLRGLGMPAPSTFAYSSADEAYTAEAIGTITSELVPRLLGTSKIRGYGQLQLRDTDGYSGWAAIDRKRRITLQLNHPDTASPITHELRI